MNTVTWQFSIMQNEKYFKKHFAIRDKEGNFTSTNKQTTKKHLKNKFKHHGKIFKQRVNKSKNQKRQ